MELNNTIIAFAGKILSGKETASTFIAKKYGIPEIDYSDFMEEALNIFDIPISRQAYTDFSMFLRSAYGGDIFERAVMRKISLNNYNAVVLQGIRRESDFAVLAGKFRFILVYIEASQERRYEWLKARNRNIGDMLLSFEDFQKRDCTEPEQRIEDLKQKATVVINNDGTRDEFIKKVDVSLMPYL